MKEFLFFIHIPKTAGTSLSTMVKLQYRSREIYPWDGIEFWDRIKEFQELAPNHPDKMNKKILKGHYPFGIHKYIDRPFVYTTILREPVSRVKSHIMQYLRMDDSKVYNKYIETGLEQTLDQMPQYGFRNLQAKWIAGEPNDTLLNDEELLEKAWKNLTTHFPVFGLVEKIDESLLRMKKSFAWRYPPVYSNLNVTKKSELASVDFSPSVMDKIKKMNSVDIEFYNRSRELFNSTNDISDRELELFRMKLKVFQFGHGIYQKIRGMIFSV